MLNCILLAVTLTHTATALPEPQVKITSKSLIDTLIKSPMLISSPFPKESEWKCTDPDTDQWGRFIGGRIFEFKTAGSEPVMINLGEYFQDDIERMIWPYYSGGWKEIREEYGITDAPPPGYWGDSTPYSEDPRFRLAAE